MSLKKVILFTLALTGTGIVSGVVACGANSTPPPKGIYYSTAELGTYSRTRQDNNLTVYIPWKETASYAKAAARFFKSAFNVEPAGDINLPEFQGYKLIFQFLGQQNTIGASGASVVSQRLDSGDFIVPDIAIAYPDVAAIFSKVGLLNDFGPNAKELVAEGFRFDVDSILQGDGVKRNHILPFAKSTDGVGFDIVVFAKILADTASLKSGSESLLVDADSDFDRMARMIVADSTFTKTMKGKKVVTNFDLRMDGIYDHNPLADANGKVSYQWSQFTNS